MPMSELATGLPATGVIGFLSAWIRTIVVVILLLTFAQLLLPRGSFKNTVELVVGLVVVITIVAPFVNTADIEWELQNMRWTLGAEGGPGSRAVLAGEVAGEAARGMPDLDSILAKGQALRSAGEAAAIKTVTKNLEAQIESLALTVEGVMACEARVALGADGDVRWVHLAVGSGEHAGTAGGASAVRVDPVEQVVVGTVGPAGQAEESVPSGLPLAAGGDDLAGRVARVVSGFYGIPLDRIQVQPFGVQSR